MRPIFGGALRAAAFLAAICAITPAQANGFTGVCSMVNPGNCLAPNADGTMPVAGTFSASLTGFAPNGSVSNNSVSASTSNVVLPTGTVVIVTNTGAAVIHVKLGTSNAVTAATSDLPIQPSSTTAMTVGGNTYIAAITDTGTSSINITGGSGLPTGWGGGVTGGGGGGGNTNLTGINSVTPAVGAGSVNTGTQRVTLASGTTVGISGTPAVTGTVGIDQVTAGANNVNINSGTVDTSGSTVNALLNSGTGSLISSTSGAIDVNVKSTTGSGLATSALQTTGNSTLSTISSNQATAANQTTGNSSLSSIASNGATAALQTTGNSSLSSINTNVSTAANQTSVIGSKAGGTAAASSQLTGGVYNTSSPTLTNGQQAASQFDVNGNLKVNVISGGGSNASVGTVGSATPSSATAMGVKDGSGNLQIPSATNPIPVTGGVAQASTTSGQTGSLIQAATVNSSPTYTNATTNPLTTDTIGALRVNVVAGGASGGTSSSFGSTYPSTGTAIGAKNGANMVNLAADASNNLNVNVAAGTVAATQSGTWNVTNVSGTVSLPTGAATAAKQPALGTAGSASTDVITVQGIASGTPQPVSGTVSANQSGTWTVQPGNTANTTAWLTSNNDGTNTQKVLAASTSAALADKAAVVALSPNPAPVCTSTIAVNQTTSTDLKTFTNFGHICSIVLVSASAQNISLTEGTGTLCATGAAAIMGGTTASMALAANGGFSAVSDRVIIKLGTSADHMCLLQSASGNVSGFITYQDHS